MHILFLGEETNPLLHWLTSQENQITHTSNKITPEYCILHNFDFVVSYNYKHLVKQPIIDLFQPNRIINLHISYLPFNRGMHPNAWSWATGVPNGVTIHHLDVGLDTGNILVQKEVDFDDVRWYI